MFFKRFQNLNFEIILRSLHQVSRFYRSRHNLHQNMLGTDKGKLVMYLSNGSGSQNAGRYITCYITYWNLLCWPQWHLSSRQMQYQYALRGAFMLKRSFSSELLQSSSLLLDRGHPIIIKFYLRALAATIHIDLSLPCT